MHGKVERQVPNDQGQCGLWGGRGIQGDMTRGNQAWRDGADHKDWDLQGWVIWFSNLIYQ
jgi:hypothetical protein